MKSYRRYKEKYLYQGIWLGSFILCFVLVSIACASRAAYALDAPVSTKIGEVVSGFPADKAGIVAGDRVVSIDGFPISDWNEIKTRIHSSNGKSLVIEVMRNNERFTFSVIAIKKKTEIDELVAPLEAPRYKIGIYPVKPSKINERR